MLLCTRPKSRPETIRTEKAQTRSTIWYKMYIDRCQQISFGAVLIVMYHIIKPPFIGIQTDNMDRYRSILLYNIVQTSLDKPTDYTAHYCDSAVD